eukprot:Hpha_TRINITY_DN26154_c0_g1::TRINITY_DN26154_c0_g1_i1::g.155278::m.155278
MAFRPAERSPIRRARRRASVESSTVQGSSPRSSIRSTSGIRSTTGSLVGLSARIRSEMHPAEELALLHSLGEVRPTEAEVVRDFHHRLGSADVIVWALDRLRDRIDEADVCTAALVALHNLSVTVKPLVANGGVDTVVSVLRMHLPLSRTAAAAVALVAKLAHEGTTCPGMVRSLLSVLEVHASDASLVRRTSSALLAAVRASEACIAEVVKEKGLPKVVRVVARHQGDLQVVRDSLELLLGVTCSRHATEEPAWRRWSASCIDKVVCAAQHHVWHQPVAEPATLLLLSLVRDEANSEALVAGQGRGPSALAFLDKALRAHGSEHVRLTVGALAAGEPLISTVVGSTTGLLSRIAARQDGDSDDDTTPGLAKQESSWQRAAVRLQESKESISLLAESAACAMCHYDSHAEIQLAGLRCFLAGAPALPLPLLQIAVERCCLALNNFPTHTDTQAAGCRLARVLLSDDAVREELSWTGLEGGLTCRAVLLAVLEGVRGASNAALEAALDACRILEQHENPLCPTDGGWAEANPNLWPEATKRTLLGACVVACGESVATCKAALRLVVQLADKLVAAGQVGRLEALFAGREGVLAALLKALARFEHDGECRGLAVGALCVLSHAMSLREAMMSAPLLGVLLGLLADKNRGVVLDAALLLGALASVRPDSGSTGQELIVVTPHDGVPPILETLRVRHLDGPVTAACIATLKSLVAGGLHEDAPRAARLRVLDSAGVPALLNTAQRHLGSEAVQTDFCFILSALAHEGQGCDVIASARGAASVVAAMERHPHAQRLQEDATMLLNTLAGSRVGVHSVQGALAAVAAAHNFPHDLAIVENTTCLVRRYAHARAAEGKTRVTQDEARLAGSILNIILMNTEVPGVQTDGCEAVADFLAVGGAERLLVTPETLKAATTAARRWHGLMEVQRAAMRALVGYFKAGSRVVPDMPLLSNLSQLVGGVVSAMGSAEDDAQLGRLCFDLLGMISAAAEREGSGGSSSSTELRRLLALSGAAQLALTLMEAHGGVHSEPRIQQGGAACIHYVCSGATKVLRLDQRNHRQGQRGDVGIALSGTIVRSVTPGSAAAASGFEPGMEVVGVNGKMVATEEDAVGALHRAPNYTEVVARVGAVPVYELVDAGALSLLLAAALGHGENAIVCEAVAAAMLSLCASGEEVCRSLINTTERRGKKGKAGCVEVLTGMMKKHVNVRGVVLPAIGVLQLVSYLPEGVASIVGAVGEVVGATLGVLSAEPHTGDRALLHTTLSVLSRFFDIRATSFPDQPPEPTRVDSIAIAAVRRFGGGGEGGLEQAEFVAFAEYAFPSLDARALHARLVGRHGVDQPLGVSDIAAGLRETPLSPEQMEHASSALGCSSPTNRGPPSGAPFVPHGIASLLGPVAVDASIGHATVLMLQNGAGRAAQRSGAVLLRGVARSSFGAERLRRVTVQSVVHSSAPVHAGSFRHSTATASAAKVALTEVAQSHRLDEDMTRVVLGGLVGMVPSCSDADFGKDIREPLVRVCVAVLENHVSSAEVTGYAAELLAYFAGCGPHRVTIGTQHGDERLVDATQRYLRRPRVCRWTLASLVALSGNVDCARRMTALSTRNLAHDALQVYSENDDADARAICVHAARLLAVLPAPATPLPPQQFIDDTEEDARETTKRLESGFAAAQRLPRVGR